MASPSRSSTSSPSSAAIIWSPPMPIARWMRHIGSVWSCARIARYQAIVWK
jgi:hypothetical protein